MHRRPIPTGPSGKTEQGGAGIDGASNDELRGSRKVFNSHIVIDGRGEIRSIYDKLHLFSVDIEGGPKLDENSFSVPGELPVAKKNG